MSNPHASWANMKRRDTGGVFTRGQQIFPRLETTPDISRAEERFAAEATLAVARGELVPTWAVDRARSILDVLARG